MALARRFRAGGVIINEHTLSREQTRAHVDVLGRWFDLVHHEEVPDRLSRPGPRPFCLLTFDDGKKSNATEAAPELERLGVPAVFYVVTGFVGGGEPLWFDRYAALREKVGTPPAGLEPETVKRLPLGLLEERLVRACDEHGVSLDADAPDIAPMSWDEARGLARGGFTVGAHTTRHAVLPRETEAAAVADIEQSMADVTSELGQECRTFAFPNGNYTARLAQHAQEAGAQTVMTTEPTWADVSFPLWRLPRVQLFGSLTRDRIEQKLAVAATGRVLNNPDGTRRLYRTINRRAARAHR